jgi:formamidopyrimidine-DNA glycosylase
MPELPEVETIRMQLEKYLVGQTITSINSLHKKSLIGNPKLVEGKKIVGAKRFGKMLDIDVEGKIDIGIHLKMSGQLLYQKEDKKNKQNSSRLIAPNNKSGYSSSTARSLPHKHTRVIIKFKSGDILYFNDQRIFGWVKIMEGDELSKLTFIKNLGKEPWDITDEEFFQLIHKRNRPVKLVILDQEIISGVGNIYANDGLWEAGIKPQRKASSLTKTESANLLKALIKVLKEGIKYGGSTGQDGKYVHLDGGSGKYQEHFRVYDKKDKKCLRKDGGVVEKITLGGRGTYFCPVCQK